MKTALEIIKFEEGWRSQPYYCSERFPTVGYGFRIGDRDAPLPCFTLPESAGEAWLLDLVKQHSEQLAAELAPLNEARQAIILSMVYQMGVHGVRLFRRMWAAIRAEDWEAAANEMLDSRWARQTPARAHRHATVMQTGSIEGVY